MGLPEAWWLKEGSEVEVNGKKLKVVKHEMLSSCEGKVCKPFKNFFLEGDCRLEVTDQEMKYFQKGKEVALKSFKVLKK